MTFRGYIFMNIRDAIAHAREHGYLVEVDTPSAPNEDMARTIFEHDGRPILFSSLPDYPGWRVVAGISSSRSYFATALHVPVDDLVQTLAMALENTVAPTLVTEAPCQEVIEEEVNLNRIPILRHFPTDGGPYATAAIVILDDPDHGPNVSFHRLQRLDERRFAARVVENRGTHTALQKAPNGLPVAICIGNSIPTLLAGSISPRPDVDELAVSNALAPTPVVRCKTVPLYVPAECEMVLEGRLIRETAAEGPFVDLTETQDIVRQSPIIEVQCITHRREPIYQALLPGKLEHKLLMGMPKEPTIFAEVNKVCRCTNVAITPGGTSWLHAVVQIEKQGPDDGHKAIEAAFRGHGSLKHVVIVDTDVNIYDPMEVEWAIATRFQAHTDLVVLTNQPGSSLDPSGMHEPGKKALTSKMGLDATIPWGGDPTSFKKIDYS
jgi:UbiD family decarboxylase